MKTLPVSSIARIALGSISLAVLPLAMGGCASDAEASRNPSVNPSNPLSGAETAGRGPAVGAARAGGLGVGTPPGTR